MKFDYEITELLVEDLTFNITQGKSNKSCINMTES